MNQNNIFITGVFYITINLLVAACGTPSAAQQPPAPKDDPIAVQDSVPYQLLTKLDCKAKLFTTDKLRNVYVVNTANELQKYDETGTLLFEYNNNRFGNIGLVDATNPFSILVFYPDYMQVFILNRTLNVTGQISLFDLDIQEVKALGMSNDNNIWIYEDMNFRLKKLSRDGRVIQESEDLRVLLQEVLRPNFLLERENYVYLNDPDVGIAVFDLFGDYDRTIPIQNLMTFQVLEGQMIYQEGTQLVALNPLTLLKKKIALPEVFQKRKDIHVRLQKDRMYVLDAGILYFYAF